MARKLIYVRFDYNVNETPDRSILFIARRRVGHEEGAVNCVRGDSLPKKLDRVMEGEEWQEMSDAFFDKLQIQNWERVYRPEGGYAGEGCQWRLMIALEDRTKYEFFGENAVPERWEDLKDVFCPFFLELGALPEPESAPEPIDPVTGESYPDINKNVWSRFDDDGYGIQNVLRPEQVKNAR